MNPLQEQVDALRQQLDTSQEENFDLQATLAAVNAESQYRIKQVEEESRNQVRVLQEELRRAQQEANLAQRRIGALENKLQKQPPRNVIPPPVQPQPAIPLQAAVELAGE